MKFQKLSLLLSAGVLAGLTTDANANIDCVETVTAVIIHSNGGVFFQTDQTCSGTWCQLAWSDAETLKKGYAMLLQAKALGAPLGFDWASISACSQFNAWAASPMYVFEK